MAKPLPCPECRAGKHPNCDGTTWNDIEDEYDWCPCTNDYHKPKEK